MEVLYWIVWGIVGIATLYGIFQWLGMFLWSWDENGKGFTIKFIILMVLLISPYFIKSFAPEYYGLSVWTLILYSIALLAHKIFIKGLKEEG